MPCDGVGAVPLVRGVDFGDAGAVLRHPWGHIRREGAYVSPGELSYGTCAVLVGQRSVITPFFLSILGRNALS